MQQYTDRVRDTGDPHSTRQQALLGADTKSARASNGDESAEEKGFHDLGHFWDITSMENKFHEDSLMGKCIALWDLGCFEEVSIDIAIVHEVYHSKIVDYVRADASNALQLFVAAYKERGCALITATSTIKGW